MKLSVILLWILYGMVSSVMMILADSYFGWGFFQ